MDNQALKHAINEVKDEMLKADIDPEHYNTNDCTFIDLAFRLLLIDELKQLNRNIEHLSSQVNRIG